MTSPVKRKLAAILAADAVGYSRAMATDEEGTMKILAAHRAVIDGIIQFHEGQIFNTAGDSVLAEFASPTQAVRCAVEIQDALKTRNDSLPEDKRMQFRIGVNLGDVMVKGEDLLGDGVNVAARLESIAEPGGIYVASSVYDQIAGKLDLGFSDLGEQSLKNIDRPVRAYRVDRDKRATPVPAARKQQKSSPMPWVGAVLAVVALGAGATWYMGQQSAARQAEAEAAKSRADAEVAKARAEADEAKKTAAAAADSAAAANRALEEQRNAEARAKAQAELARARADAEATRRKADAELAAAAEARRSAEAAAKSATTVKVAAKPAPSYAGAWTAIFNCVAFAEMPAQTFNIPATFAGGRFEALRGKPPEPGSMQFGGAPSTDGSLQLSGRGFDHRKHVLGQPYDVSFSGKIAADRYEGRGKLGTRDCGLALVRAVQAPTSAAAASRSYEGQWKGTFACSGGRDPDRTFPALFSYSAKGFEVQANKPGQAGYRLLAGTPQPDGNMRLTGNAFGDPKNPPYAASVDGRFSGERYEGKGKFLDRNCILTFARP